MTTKAAFIAALGGAKVPLGVPIEFVRSSANILTASAHGLKTGAGPYKVMTTNADAPSGLVVAKHAETFMTGTTMIATDVLIVAGKSYTLEAAPADDGDVDLGQTDAETAMNLVHAINQEVDVAATTYDVDTVGNPTVRAVALSSGVNGAAALLVIKARTLDAAIGNAITVSSVDGTMVVDNGTLQNGASGTDYFVIRLSADTFSLATTHALALAGTAQALADAGTGVHILVTTVDTVAEALWNAFVVEGAVAGRTFEVLSAGGWRRVDPHQLVGGDRIRVLDNGVVQSLASTIRDGDISGIYTVAQVQRSVLIAVATASGVNEVSIPFDTP